MSQTQVKNGGRRRRGSRRASKSAKTRRGNRRRNSSGGMVGVMEAAHAALLPALLYMGQKRLQNRSRRHRRR